MAISKVVVIDGNNLTVRIDRGVAGRGITDVQPIEIDNALYLEFFFSDGTTETVGPVGTIQYIGESPIVVEASTISLSTVPVSLGGTGQITANAAFNALAPSQTGNAGKYLTTDGSNTSWANNPLGTVTSVDMSVPTGLTISGNPITTSGTLAVGLQSGYSIPTTASQANWDTAYSERQQWDGGSTNLVAATGRTSLGLGTIATQDANSVAITGGSITGITDLAVDDGGTGASTAAGARSNLGAAASATTISAGTGLTGGGDLSANRTISIANTAVTAGSYGSASNTLSATVNAQGQLTALAATPIAIANTQVSGLGTMSTQNSNAVTITGGSITGITDLAIADGGTGASTAADARSNLGLGTAAVLNAGVANGVATLDAGGTVPLSQIPASIQGGVSYQGSWNAATNTPTIVSGVGTKGHYYVVSVAGSTNIDGITDWLPGDWIIFNGSAWEQIDNTDAVASVNGYTGVVVLSNTDVGAPSTSLTISAGTGLSGGGDLTTNRTLSIANTAVSAGSYGTASAVPSFTVNGQGQLTAAANTTIAIANTQVSGLGTMSTQNANAVAVTGGTIDGATIGGTTAAAVTGTTVTGTTKVVSPYLDAVGSAGGQLRNSSGTSQLSWGAGGGSNLTLEVATNINPANAAVSISPTGTGTVTINPATAGTINNMAIGGTTSAAVSATTLTTSSTVTLNGGTANGVAYLNGSKVMTTGSALTFDGTNFRNTSGVFEGIDNMTLSALVSSTNATVLTLNSAGTSGTTRFQINGSEQMCLTSTGLGIGTSSPTDKLHVVGLARINTGTYSAGYGLTFQANSETSRTYQMGMVTGGAFAIYDSAAAAQRVTLTAAGELLVGTTSSAIDASPGIKFNPAQSGANAPTLAVVTAASTNTTVSFSAYSTGAGAYRFYVDNAGTIFATSTSISGISDATLKENVRDLETGLTEVMALRPRRFDWKNGDAQNVAGFVAQEVEQVLPELVTDYRYSEGVTKKSLKMGDILPTLVKAIQEQQAIIESLKARLDAANL